MDAEPLDIVAAFKALAQRQPAAPWLHVPGQATLTYADLGRQIDHVRECLRGGGIMPGDIVAGFVRARPQMALACATLPASSTFAPLSPTLTGAAYASLLARLRPRAVLVPAAGDHPLCTAAQQLGIAQIQAKTDPDAPAAPFTLRLPAAANFAAADARRRPEYAYLQVTSGTTGPPKLVPLGHRQMLAFARTINDWFGLTPDDVGCHIASLHLAQGLRATLLIPTLGGGALACLPESDIDALVSAVGRYRPTYLSATFTILRALLRRGDEIRGQLANSRLRFLRAASGRLEPEEIDRLEELFGAPVLVSLGSTETLAIANDPLPPRPRKRGAAGVATGCELAVRDRAGRMGSRGSSGEILVRGPLVFGGYLDDPELTARSFVDGWFRTGDLGSIDLEGYLFVEGRIKELINRGDEKIAPAEIDRVLESFSGVREAAAFGVAHPTLGEEIVAAVVRDPDAAITAAGVLEELRRRLGPTRVPRAIHFVERLPRTDSGKLRRAALAELVGRDALAAGVSDRPSAPSTPLSSLEAALGVLWAETLQVDAVGPDDDFLLLGGDSLSAARLQVQIKALVGIELPLEALLGNAAMISGIARAIEHERRQLPRE